MKDRKTERQNWNAGNSYQWFLLWMRKEVPVGKTGNVRKTFSSCRLFVRGLKNLERTYPLELQESLYIGKVDNGEISAAVFVFRVNADTLFFCRNNP